MSAKRERHSLDISIDVEGILHAHRQSASRRPWRTWMTYDMDEMTATTGSYGDPRRILHARLHLDAYRYPLLPRLVSFSLFSAPRPTPVTHLINR